MAWWRRLTNTFRRQRLDDDIDAELRFHVEMRAADLVRGGMHPDDAQREARRLLGNHASLRDRTRESDVWIRLETTLHDARYALRLLARTPMFTLAAVLTLAVGIGVNTAMFGVVYGVLIRPLPYTDAERLHMVFQTSARGGRTRLAPLDFVDVNAQARTFSSAGIVGNGFTLSGDGDPELVIGHLVTADFFALLGTRPLHGTTFGRAEAAAANNQVIVLSHALWQRRYGGDPTIVGRTIPVNNRPYTVVGVMGPAFTFQSARYQLWVPFPLQGANPDNVPITRNSRFMQVLARVHPGVAPAAAASELRAIATTLAQAAPARGDASFVMSSLTEETVGNVRDALTLLFTAVVLLLLIACGNVTSLLLARFSVRTEEVLVRAALGASRARLVRQFVIETLVLYAIGTAAGVMLAIWLLSLVRSLGPAAIPRVNDVTLAAPVLLFTCVTSLVAALVFGIVPAIQATRTGSASALRARTATTSRSHQRLRSTIVVAQVAVALCLLLGASLVARSLVNLEAVEKGFDPAGRLTFGFVIPAARFPDAPSMHAYYRRVVEALAARSEFRAVGTTTAFPMTGQDMENSFSIDGYVPPAAGQGPVAAMRGVSPGYTEAMGIEIRAGRPLQPADHERAAPVAVVNEAFARRFLNGRDPIGARIAEGGPDGWRTVVGVAADVKHRGLAAEARPEVLIPYTQLDAAFLTMWARGVAVVVRTDIDLSAAATLVRQQVREVDPHLPLVELKPVAELVSASVAEPRFRTFLLGAFALASVVLAAVGIFGVLSYLVSERTREIGIRMALGARPQTIFRDVLVQGGWLVGMGSVLGLAGGAALSRWIRTLLFQVSPTDPITLAAATLGLAAIALVATLVPARRATRVNPLSALRA